MAINYRSEEPIGINFTTIDLVQQFALGSIYCGKDATYGQGEFQYMKFTGTVAAGDLVVFNRAAGTCVQSPLAATKGSLGICMAAQLTGQYGFVMIRGVHDAANVLAGAAVQYGPNYGSAITVGRVTNAVTANWIVDGVAVTVTGNGSNVGSVELYWPVCTGR